MVKCTDFCYLGIVIYIKCYKTKTIVKTLKKVELNQLSFNIFLTATSFPIFYV